MKIKTKLHKMTIEYYCLISLLNHIVTLYLYDWDAWDIWDAWHVDSLVDIIRHIVLDHHQSLSWNM